jgi:hypothetical protein
MIWASVNRDFLIDLPRRCGSLHFRTVAFQGELTNSSSPTAPRPATATSTSGSIEIEFGGARILLRGAVDPASLGFVFDLLGSR